MNEKTNTPGDSEEQVRDRAIRLFTFLRELTELRTKTIRTLDHYEKVLWFNDVPRETGCYCIAWSQADDEEKADVWVEIKKPRLKAAPKVPDVLEPWLDPREVTNSSREFPELRERIVVSLPGDANKEATGEARTVVRELTECPEVKPLWERYVEEQWWPWAEEDRRLQAVQTIYTDLFAIYQKQQRLGEAYEVVLGLGYLTWKTTNGHEVKRHIITAQTSLTFDAARGVITLGPAGEGAKPTLEQDMLEPQERPDAIEQNAIERQVAEIGDALWDGSQVPVVLKAWVHAVSPRGQSDETLIPQSELGSDPRINLAPAVILRKRTERSMLRVFQEIIEQLRSGQPVPVGVRRLVGILDDADNNADEQADSSTDTGLTSPIQETFFPLPANNEQLEIVRKLSMRQGVLVQGPPGTGKSHTIANLVSHLLATGQRVLVTSHTARALRNLQDKIPKEIANLCVILLGDDRNALTALEDSVRGITDRYNTWNSDLNLRHIAELEKRLDDSRRAEASTLNDLRAIREAETYHHPPRFGTYEGTAQAIAERLREEEPRYSWISAQPDEKEEPALSNIEAAELLRLLQNIDDAREEELTKETVDPDSLITPDDFLAHVRKEAEAYARYNAVVGRRTHPSYVPLASTSWDQRSKLADGLSDLRVAYQALLGHVQPWLREAATQILADQDRSWRELLTVTREHLEAIGERARRASERQISGLKETDRNVVKAHATALLQHMETGGRLGFGPFRPTSVKNAIYLVKQVRVDGHLCNKPQPLRDLLEWIEIADRLEALRTHWSLFIAPSSGSFAAQVAEYWDLSELLQKALKLHDKVLDLRGIIGPISGLVEPTWHNHEDLRVLQDVLEAVTLEERFEEARKSFAPLESHLDRAAIGPNSHPIVKQLLEAVRARDEREYAEAYQTLCSVRKLRDDLKRRHGLLDSLKASAPVLASELKSSFRDPVWDKRMGEFTAAWNWARADYWLRRLSDPRTQEQLSRDLERYRDDIRRFICELAAANAWGHCFSRLTEHERQHLMAWTKAMRRIGKGTGKYASMHRRAAREHMEQCRSAIPAWIMPIYRVAETVRPGVDTFDVIIVDEASQSGPEAVFLQYLAKKMVVVGDDKQISPDFVGVTREDVELLRQRHILDLPHSDALGVDNSFFDQAEIRYGGRIRLREHFRCMPEIIQFSNNLCYRTEPLIPLRQYGAGRLTPVIVTHHILNGYQQGRSPRIVNPPEAEAIVEQIEKCCEDRAYDGKTMGVISLLGEDQARLIERLLLEKIGPEEMEKRQLVCGDAYAFQGDERDIMFLSLVSAPTEGQRIGTLTSTRDERRFNVAASRAKDQMWLFHAATLNDLSPNCLRYRLLQYCQNPKLEPTTVDGLNVEQLRVLARTVNRNREKPPLPFDSWFEVDVFLKIGDRGYRVIPQFEIVGRYIDLLVEGMQGRLAVECHGDVWHGRDRYEQDMARRRQLERCGLTFWIVWGSTFYREPEAALEGLWNTLDRLGIHPSSQYARAGSAHADGGCTPSADVPPGSAEVQNGSSVTGQTKQDQTSRDNDRTDEPNVSQHELRLGKVEDDRAWVSQMKAPIWYALYDWVTKLGHFQQSERSFIHRIARAIARKTTISPADARQARKLYERALRRGFTSP